MNIKRIYTIFVRQLFLTKRSVARLFGLFYWSTLELFLWGVLTMYLQRAGGAQLNFITVLFGSIIFWNFLVRVQHGVTVSFLEDVWTRNFINLFSSPLSVNEYAAGLIVTSVFNTLISMASMVLLAWLLFAYNIFQFGFTLIPFIFILFVFGWAVGIFTTGLIFRVGPSAEILAWSIAALLSPLSGVFYPVSALPKFLQYVAYALPSSYVFEAMRGVVLHGTLDTKAMFTAFLLALLFFIASYIFLVRSYKLVLRKGLFTRFMTG